MACRGSGVQIPSAPHFKMNNSYIKKVILETKELFTSQALIAILSLLQVSYVVKQLGPQNYGKIALFITFTSLFFRGLHSKNSDVVLLTLKKDTKNILYPAFLFDLLIGLAAFILCFSIYFTPYISKIDLNDFSSYFIFYLVCRVILNFSETSKAILISKDKLKLLSSIELFGIFMRFLFITSLVYLNPSVESYLLGQSLYMLCFGIFCFFVSIKQLKETDYQSSMTIKEYWESIKLIYKKIRYDQIIGLIPQHFDVLLLSVISDITIVGIYKFAKRLVEPINYITTAFNPWIQSKYSANKFINFNNFVKKILLPASLSILLIFIFGGREIITVIGSEEFYSAYDSLIILTIGYLIYLLTFWIRQSLLFNNLITYHVYGRVIYSIVFITLSIPLTTLYSANGLSASLTLAILFQKFYELYIYKNKISLKSSN